MILVTVIGAIFINLGISLLHGDQDAVHRIHCNRYHLNLGQRLIMILTTRYKKERCRGQEKKEAIRIALSTSISSVIVSALGFFAATFGVGLFRH